MFSYFYINIIWIASNKNDFCESIVILRPPQTSFIRNIYYTRLFCIIIFMTELFELVCQTKRST